MGRGDDLVPAARRAAVLLRVRVRQGRGRVRRALVPVLLASVAAAGAWAIATGVLGHETPFFAPVSAWVALGFHADRNLRRVAELAVGVAVGVLLGDLLVHVIGSGAVQIAVVLVVAALLGRFLDRGDLLATQAGVQAIVIVALPVARTGSPLDRWTDALVGGALALLVAALSPQDPRRRVRGLAEESLTEIAEVLRYLAAGLRPGGVADAEEALTRGRACEPLLEQWRRAAGAARQSARVSPAFRRHRGELVGLEQSAVRAELAVRSLRVLARRSLIAVRDGVHSAALADVVGRVADGVDALGEALAGGVDPARARELLADAAARLDPHLLAPDRWHVQALVLLLRSVVVDLLGAAGADEAEAHAALPEL